MNKLILASVLVSCSVHAEFKDGNKLLAELSGNTSDYIHGIGYVMGVYDTTQGITHCPPANVTAGQVTDMVKRYMEVNPDIRHNTADRIIGVVLRRSWPCANNSGGRTL